MHHPLDWLSDLEMTSVERKLKCFDLVLRGHVHELDDKQICTQRYKTIYNTSGKLYPIDTYYSGYSILDIDMDLYTCSIYSREYLKSPREDFDKALRINEEGKVVYQLNTYDETRAVMYDLKLQLQKFYENIAEKYTMLKNIDSYSTDKVDDFFVEPILFEKTEYVHTKSTNKKTQMEIPISLTDLIGNTVGESEYSYVTKEVYETLADTFRKEAHAEVMRDLRHMTLDGYEEGSTEDLMMEETELLEEQVIKRMEREVLYKAMQSISESQRKRLYLYFFEEMTIRDIAKKQGVSRNAVWKSLQAMIAQIRKFKKIWFSECAKFPTKKKQVARPAFCIG